MILFLFLHENICCGYSLELPQQNTSDIPKLSHSLCFHGKIRKISVLFSGKVLNLDLCLIQAIFSQISPPQNLKSQKTDNLVVLNPCLAEHGYTLPLQTV